MAAVAVLLAVGQYLASPATAIRTAQQAIELRDPALFNAQVDYVKLRANLLKQLLSKTTVGLKAPSGVTQEELLYFMLEKAVTEETLPNLLMQATKSGDTISNSSLKWDVGFGLNQVTVHLYAPIDGPRNRAEELVLLFERDSIFSTTWHLTGMTLPKNF